MSHFCKARSVCCGSKEVEGEGIDCKEDAKHFMRWTTYDLKSKRDKSFPNHRVIPLNLTKQETEGDVFICSSMGYENCRMSGAGTSLLRPSGC